MKVYEVWKYGCNIVIHDAKKMTDKTVWLISKRTGTVDRRSIISEYSSFFKTFDEAKDFLIKRLENKIDYLQREKVRFQNDLIVVKKLTEL